MIDKISAGKKLIFLLFFSSLFIFFNNWIFVFTSLIVIFVFSLIYATKPQFSDRILSLSVISLFVILFQLLFGLSISFVDKLIQGSLAAARLMTLSLLVLLFTSSTSTAEILEIFSFLPAKMRLMLTICFSFIPIIFAESQKITLAQSARGLRKGIFPILIPLLHRTLSRAQQIVIVLESRGYQDV